MNGKKPSKFVTRRELPKLLMGIAETKSINFAGSFAGIDDANTLQVPINTIARGNGQNNREGDTVQTHSAYVSFGFSPSNISPPARPYHVRVIMYTPIDGVTTLDVLPFAVAPQQDNIFWYDKTFPVGWTNSISNAQGEIKKKWKPYMKTVWAGSSNTDFVKNPLHLMISTNCPAGETIGVSFSSSVYFKDL